MRKEKVVVGLDVGTTKVVALVGNVIDGAIEVIGLGKAESHGLEKGVVVDIGRTIRNLDDLISQLVIVSQSFACAAFICACGVAFDRGIISRSSSKLLAYPFSLGIGATPGTY